MMDELDIFGDITNMVSFFNAFDALKEYIHGINKVKGFYDDQDCHNKPTVMLALMITEISEAIEALRVDDQQSEKIPEFTLLEEELADTMIRLLDFAEFKELRLMHAVLAKVAYNEQRPQKHDKNF